MNRDIRTVARWVRDMTVAPTDVVAAAQRLLQPRKAPKKSVETHDSRPARKQRHREATAEIREAVFRRAAGLCERCGIRRPEHMHHLASGSGRRRQRQAIGTTVALCVACHEFLHKWPLEARAWGERLMAKVAR